MTRSATRLAFPDFVQGRVFELGTVTIDQDEMTAFARRFDPQPFHVDPVAGADNPVLGGLCASGWFTASLWMRAWVDGVLSRTDSLGSPGGGECTWPAPVFPGDELTARAEVLGARMSRSKPWLGLVDVRATMHRGEDCVFRFRFTVLIRTGS